MTRGRRGRDAAVLIVLRRRRLDGTAAATATIVTFGDAIAPGLREGERAVSRHSFLLPQLALLTDNFLFQMFNNSNVG